MNLNHKLSTNPLMELNVLIFFGRNGGYDLLAGSKVRKSKSLIFYLD